MSTTVTSKGQVTIPKPVRDRLNIKPGSQVDFELAPDGRRRAGEGRARNRPLRQRAGSIVCAASLKSDMTTDEIMALMRGDPAEV